MEDLNLNKFHMLTKYTNEDIAACKLKIKNDEKLYKLNSIFNII